MPIQKRPCPHDMTFPRSTRHMPADEKQCPICLEDYFSTPPDRDRIVPIKARCEHVFCRECFETHRSCELKCPLPWCSVFLPVQPDDCELCAYWVRTHLDSLLLTVRPTEMVSSIDEALRQLALEDDFFLIPAQMRKKFLKHIRDTLTVYEWQYHPGDDLAEILDPFLAVTDPDLARDLFPDLSLPAPNPALFPPREVNPDDYASGQEPWIAAFLRQWAQEYEKDNGEVKEGWGDWSMRRDNDDQEEEWRWAFKRIVAHRTESDGSIMYLVKWCGRRHYDSWTSREQLDEKFWKKYDEANGVEGQKGRSKKRQRRA